MDLRTYLNRCHDRHVAADLCIPERTVASWRRGERFPRPDMLLRLLERSKGEIDLERSLRVEIGQEQPVP